MGQHIDDTLLAAAESRNGTRAAHRQMLVDQQEEGLGLRRANPIRAQASELIGSVRTPKVPNIEG